VGLPVGVVLDWQYPIEGSDVVITELASGWCTGTTCPAPNSWLRGVAFESGEILWTVDLAQFGIPDPRPWYIADPDAGQLAVLIHNGSAQQSGTDGVDLPPETPVALVILDIDTGQVVQTGQVTYQPPSDMQENLHGPELTAFTRGTVILWPMPGPADTYTTHAYSIDNLNQPKWTAPGVHPLADFASAVPKAVGEWITTPYGYVALEDGTPAPWGNELVLADEYGFPPDLPLIFYGAADDGAVFQIQTDRWDFNTCQLWDITNDQALWPEGVPCIGAWSFVREGGLYYVNHYEEQPISGESKQVLSVVSADDGHLLWQSQAGWAELVADGRVLVSEYLPTWGDYGYGPGLVLEATSGQVIKHLPLPESSHRVPGISLIYTLADGGNMVEAWDLFGDATDPLWELDIGEQRRFGNSRPDLVVISRDEATYWLVQAS